MVFGLLVATAVQWTITLGLSEVASAFPSAGVSGSQITLNDADLGAEVYDCRDNTISPTS